jgi:cytochrome c nitrite reductase small subunit
MIMKIKDYLKWFRTSLSKIGKTRIIVSILTGVLLGVGTYTFIYAKGVSYFSDDPAACANCHIMNAQYNGWVKSSHHAVAVCNDCHTPKGFVDKYFTKGLNGFNHSAAFTTGWYRYPIQIGDRNKRIVEESCRTCHSAVVELMERYADPDEPILCSRCHDTVGHIVR